MKNAEEAAIEYGIGEEGDACDVDLDEKSKVVQNLANNRATSTKTCSK